MDTYLQTNLQTNQTNVPGLSSSKVELSISCKDLPDLDTYSKSDPQVTVDMRTSVGKTEVIKNNLSPKFSTRVKVEYHFQELQELRFHVIDVDKNGKFDEIGVVGNTKTERVTHKYRAKSFITVTAEEMKTGAEKDVYFTIAGSNLDKKDFLGKSDPFLEISRPSSSKPGKWYMVHRTETIKKTLDPQWKPFDLPLSRLNQGKMDTKLKFDVYDWNSSGKSDFIGSFQASIPELQKKTQWPLVNPKKAKKRRYVDSGVLTIKIQVVDCYTFLDYIMGGTEINLMLAIDFTGSNGKPTDPNSLHAIKVGQLNEYEQVMTTVGNILLSYDTDGSVPTFGFGARLNEPSSKANIRHERGGTVSQCFHINANPNDAEVPGGLANVIGTYHQVVNSGKLKFYGPTTFAYIINEAATLAAEHHQNAADAQAFVILLIITDGVIPNESDFIATKEAIIDASHLPMSIVIVGVGTEDFAQMDELDADDGLLKVRGKEAAADIVQFVPFRNFKNQPDQLAAHVLGEIPGQLVSYMKRHKIKARPPPTTDDIARMQMNYMDAFKTNTATSTTAPPFQDAFYAAPTSAPTITTAGGHGHGHQHGHGHGSGGSRSPRPSAASSHPPSGAPLDGAGGAYATQAPNPFGQPPYDSGAPPPAGPYGTHVPPYGYPPQPYYAPHYGQPYPYYPPPGGAWPGYGAPPGAPPAGDGAPPTATGHPDSHAPPPAGAWGAPPPGQWGAPPPGYWGPPPDPSAPAPASAGAPPTGDGAPGGAPPTGTTHPDPHAPPPAGTWGAPPPAYWGPPPAGAPPTGDGAPPTATGHPDPHAPPPAGAWGAPPPGQWGAPPPGYWGPPPDPTATGQWQQPPAGAWPGYAPGTNPSPALTGSNPQ